MKFEKSVSTIYVSQGKRSAWTRREEGDGGGTTGRLERPQVVRRALARSSPETVVNYEPGGERVIVKGKIGPFRSRIC